MTSVGNKRIARNSMFLYIRTLMILLVELYASRLILIALGVEDYGIYNVVGGIVLMFRILGGAMTTASQRFIIFALGERNEQKLWRVFSTSVSLHLLIGVGIVILLEGAGGWFLNTQLNIPENRIYAAHWVLQCSIITFFFSVISVPYTSLIIAHEHMNAFAYIGILEAVLKIIAVFVLQFCGFDKLIFYAILMLGISILLRIVYSAYSHKCFPEAKNLKLIIDNDLYKQMLSFVGWNMWGNGSLILRNQGIDILLNVFFGVTVNAAKGISNQVQSGISQFITNFQTALVPQLTTAIAQKDHQRMQELLFKGSKFSFFLMAIIAVPILIMVDFILNIWLTKVPPYTGVFVQWIVIYLLWDTLSRCLINSILANGVIRNYQVTVGFLKLLVLPICWGILMLGGSPVTGVIVNVMMEILCLWVRLYYARKYLNINIWNYLYNVVLKCWLIFIMAIILPLLYFNWNLCNVYCLALLSLLSPSFCILYVGMTKKERIALKGILLKRISKN